MQETLRGANLDVCDTAGIEPAFRFRSALAQGIRYLAAQVIITSTIFGTRNSMTEPPRFLPMASMSPDLNLRAAIPIKKGVAAIIAGGLLHVGWSHTAHDLRIACRHLNARISILMVRRCCGWQVENAPAGFRGVPVTCTAPAKVGSYSPWAGYRNSPRVNCTDCRTGSPTNAPFSIIITPRTIG